VWDADNRFTRRIYTQGAEQLGFRPHKHPELWGFAAQSLEYPDVTRLSGTGTARSRMNARCAGVSMYPASTLLPGTRMPQTTTGKSFAAPTASDAMQHGREQLGAASCLPGCVVPLGGRRPVDEPKPKLLGPNRPRVCSLAHFKFARWSVSSSGRYTYYFRSTIRPLQSVPRLLDLPSGQEKVRGVMP